MTFVIEAPADDACIAALLERDRLWSAYGLCDLELPYRRHARFVGAWAEDTLVAVVLVYAPPGFEGVLPFGDPAGVAAIMMSDCDLPTRPFFLLAHEHVSALEHRYSVPRWISMLRMAVHRSTFLPPWEVERSVRLRTVDGPEIEALYAEEGGSDFFDVGALDHGLYFGVFAGQSLVAVAGTHAWSSSHRIGAIGGVFTHPAYRGRGLATLTTGAVARSLLSAGVDDVVLNVRADNEAALKAYAHLGFTTVRPYVEGTPIYSHCDEDTPDRDVGDRQVHTDS